MRKWIKIIESENTDAAALGFTVKAWHGTGSNKFDSFDKERGKGSPVKGHAPFFSTVKAESQGYAKQHDNGRVMNVLLRIKKPLVIHGLLDPISKEIYDLIKGDRLYSTGLYSEPTGDGKYNDDYNKSFRDAQSIVASDYYRQHNDYNHKIVWNEIYDRLIKAGYDAIIWKNTPADHTHGYYDSIQMLDLSGIRSTRAKFDPAKAHEEGLMK